MPDIDPSRIEIVYALGCLEDAHMIAMPGQAPASKRDDIKSAIDAARPLILEALSHLAKAEAMLVDE